MKRHAEDELQQADEGGRSLFEIVPRDEDTRIASFCVLKDLLSYRLVCQRFRKAAPLVDMASVPVPPPSTNILIIGGPQVTDECLTKTLSVALASNTNLMAICLRNGVWEANASWEALLRFCLAGDSTGTYVTVYTTQNAYSKIPMALGNHPRITRIVNNNPRLKKSPDGCDTWYRKDGRWIHKGEEDCWEQPPESFCDIADILRIYPHISAEVLIEQFVVGGTVSWLNTHHLIAGM